MSEHFVVQGLAAGRGLKGTIPVRGAKNAALKELAAGLLFRDEVRFTNMPVIEDVSRLIGLLRRMGVLIEGRRTVRMRTPRRMTTELPPDEAERLRASVVLTGPILARWGSVTFPHPGGCLIGARPVDLFLEGFQKMGARIREKNGGYEITAPGGALKGANIFFRTQSVTGTETLMMAAVLARGTTVLENAALEPEIASLAAFLNACGADIRGAGTPTVTVKGGRLLSARGAVWRTPPDRIETGSFLILGALAGDDILITRCNPAECKAVIAVLERAGVPLETSRRTIRIRRAKRYRAVDIKTHEYPGFPTDLQALMAVFLSQAEGEALVFETIFEGRLRYVDELVKMGASLNVCDPHRIIVRGPTRLAGAELESPDLRAGLAYLIAALVADGESVIHTVYNIDRGYERIEERLRKVGADIQRVKE
ncbi:MAG: UDP-N-acetylglucosamine 1-carboxyvinyltransferase [Parcubacteria group bacterium]|nr:UDP-N-acetylglucosamine 1-carboxyvinyltransferase [Parcubacteria group bacterium]